MTSSAADVGVGSQLGKYEIIKRLATGGMAEIFLARVSGLPGFQKMVVLKRILPQFATKTDFIEMFLDEARIAATLQHPNVVQMYDVGVIDGNYFIAMEYLHGEDVRSIMKGLFLKDQKLPINHALNIVIGIASGLHYAHEKVGFDGKPLHIVHRDVTPQNVIVTYDGAIKLLDFGIAKASNRFGETRFGTLKGKVPYMSPEQCRGEPLDRRSDIFSLGIMLYELTLGKRLYRGKSDFEVLKQIVEGTVTPPREIDPSYPAELEQIVMRALIKEADQRYQTVREMQVDLEALVRADRLHVSPIALGHFMEELFGHKIEAWREAGSATDALQEQRTVDADPADEEYDLVSRTQTGEASRIERERAAFKRKLERAPTRPPTMPLPVNLEVLAPAAAEASVAPGESAGDVDASGREESTRIARNTDAAIPALPAEDLVLIESPTWKRWATLVGALALIGSGVGLYPHLRSPSSLPPPIAAAAESERPSHSTPAGATGLKAPNDPRIELPGVDPPKLAPKAPPVAAVATAPVKPSGTTTRSTRSKSTTNPPLPDESTSSSTAKKPHDPAPESDKAPVGDGSLVLMTSPWCNVRIDDSDKGPTPINAKLAAGKHTLVLTNKEFNINRTITIKIPPGETVRKRLDFQ